MLRIFISFYLFIVLALVGLTSLLDTLMLENTSENKQIESLAQSLRFVQQDTDIAELNDSAHLSAQKIPSSSLALAPSQEIQFQQQGYIISYETDDTPNIYTQLPDGHYLQVKMAENDRPIGVIFWYRIAFFTLLALLVALWTWPLWRDIKKLEKAARSVQTDGSIESVNLSPSSNLNVISQALDNLSQQVRNLLNNQRELTSAVAHEFRTPLARLKFSMATLPDSTLQTDMQEDLNELDRLTQEMLEFSQSEHHTPELSVAEIPVKEMTQALIAGLPKQHTEKISINNLCQEHTLIADGHFVERALLNLINNALKYAEQRIQVSSEVTQSGLLLVVEDDGPGIPQDLRSKIFDAFYRPDQSRTRDKGGAGLGLATVKKIQQWHGGVVWVGDSELGGARFVLSYPYQG
ncbi:ATP-binding protein [Planctobacterium marinum]|uniref:histidine kinase n=1 Tax=Planctobacterium marinum TaxID=1631968 RepID=A0AA48I9C3_9ALTE|nr:two-component sensor histidine kinase [Planctobacterium marinum]